MHGRPALALPEGGQVTAGQGSIGAPANSSLVIKQDSQRLAIDWLRFGIRAGESVRFDQPGASAIALNRVLGNEASHIYGSLSANGQVFLLNPNGVLFAPGSQVNVGGLVASTLGLSNEDFLAGRFVFKKEKNAGTVVNQGAITAGYAALLGPQVSNEGIITATLGTVALAAGEQVTLNLNGTSLVGLTVDKGALDALAANKQLIRADGGTVIMTAKATDQVLRNVVNNEGIIEAGTISQRDGVIRLESTGSGITSVSGSLSAKQIAVTGDKVGLFDGARLDASAEGGGGTILVGGNYQGKGPERNASETYVASDAKLTADAIGEGDGGKVIVWADDVTRFYGSVSARGGDNSGDGGFVEVSGKDTLVFKGAVDTRAPRGKTGMLLLDPANITIADGIGDSLADGDALNNSFSGVPSGVTGAVASGDNPAGTLTLFESELEGIAATTSISLAATANITIANLTDNLLNLAQTAGNSVTFTAGTTFLMTATDTIQTQGGALNVTAPGGATLGALATGGGAITINVGAASTASGVISGAGTSLTKQGAGTLTLSGNNTYTGATNINAGTLALGTADQRISDASAVTVAAGATFNLGTFTETIGSLAGAGTVTKSGAGTDTLTVGGDNTSTTFSGVIQNPAGILNLTKQGTGTLTLSGANTYTGVTRINAGVLSTSLLANGGVASNIGASTNAAANLVLAGGTLQYTGPTVSTNRNYTLIAGTTSTLDVTTGGTTLTISGASTATTGALTKAGPGTLTLSGANLYTGLTTVNAGTLRYGANNALATGAVTVNDGGSYDLAGFSDSIGALTVNSGATGGAVTTGAGTLTLTGNITSGGGAANASIAGNLAFGATRTITTTAAADGLTVSAAISGAGGLTKAGAGTLTLSGANTYTGVTRVNAGVLSTSLLANGGVASNIGASTNAAANLVLAGGTLRYTGPTVSTNRNYTLIAGTTSTLDVTTGGTTLTISGASTATTGALTKAGPGTLTLSGANLYTGLTTVNAGTLRYGANNALATGAVTVNDGGSYDLAGFSDSIGALTVNSGATGGAVTTGAGTLTLTGNITSGGGAANASIAGNLAFGATRTITTTAAADGLTVSAAISGAGGLTKAGAGTLTLSGTNAYTGTTTINAGTLRLAGGNAIANTGAVTLANVAGAVLDLNGTSETIGSLAGGGATGGNVTLGAGTLSAGGNNATTTYTGVISGTGGLTKQGTGTMTLSGNNAYTGATTVSAGTLTLGAANRIADASALTVAGGATFNMAGFAETLGSLAGAGNITMGAGTLSAGGDNTSTAFSGVISGTGGLTKQGTGSLTLSGANTYTGATAVGAGTLVAASNAALGTTAGGATVANGATLEIANGVAIGAEALNVSGAGVGANGALVVTAGAASYAGAVTLGASASMGGNGSLTLSGVVNDVAAGTSTLTQTGSGTLTLSNTVGSTNALAAIVTSAGQTTAIDGGSVRTTGAQTYGGTVTTGGATTLISTGGGNITANHANNDFNGNLAISTGGTASIVDSNALDLGVSSVGSLTAQALSGDLTLNGAITATAAGDSIVLAAGGNFMNAGAFSLNPGAGRWLVYSTNPASDTRGGLVYNFKHYGLILAGPYGGPGTGNGFIYSDAPTITASLIGSTSKVYDGAVTATLVAGNYATSGAIDGDTVTLDNPATGAYDDRNVGTTNVTATVAIASASNGAASVYGYTLASTSASGNIGDITQRPITVSAVTDTKTYDGSTASAAVPTISVGTLAPVGGDSAAFTQSFDNRNAGAGKTLTPAGAVNDGNGGANYLVTFLTDSTGVINQRSITVSAVTDTKTYDGSTASAGVPTISVGSLAPVGGDSAAFTQSFDNRNAGSNKTLTPAGAVNDGNGGANYLITFLTDSTGVINQRSITVSAVTDTKTYDGSTASAGVPTISVGSLAPVGGDSAAFTQSFDNRNAGAGKTLTPAGAVNDGNGGANYLVTFVTDSTGVINQRSITVSAVTDTKTYDGSTASAAVPTISVGSLAPVGGDSAAFTQTFDNRNAGSSKTLTPAGAVNDGNGGANYLVTFVSDSTGVINQRSITVSAVTDTKTYDGSTGSAAVPTISVGSLAPVGGDTAAFTQSFDNRNAGSSKTLTPAGAVNDGNGGANYLVTFLTDSTGVINQRSITVSAVTDTKTYDGATSSAAVPTISVGTLAPVGGDSAAFTQSFDNRNAGSNKTLTPAGAVNDGNGGANYLVTFLTNSTGVINQRSITVSAVTDTKTYDGSTASVGVPTISAGSLAPVGGDSAAFTQSFDDRNAGSNKTLTPVGAVNDGNGGANYLITFATDTTGVINQRSITVSAVTDTKTYDGATSSAGVPTISVGTLAPVGGDTAAFTQSFDNRNAGSSKTLTPAGAVNDGNGGANYLVTFVTDSTGVINQRSITVSAVTDTKTYDGATSSAAVPTISVGTLAPVGGDSAAFTQSFDNRNAGSSKTLTPAGAVNDGNGGANYLVTFLTDSTGVINQRSITVSAVTDTKTYDGSTASAGVPTISVGSLAPVGGDSAAFTQSFDNRNAGSNKTLTPAGAVNDGNGGANYLVTFATDTTGQIAAALLTVTAQAHTRGYDGTTSSSVAPALAGTLFDPLGSAALQTFDTRNVGTGKTLTPSGLVVNDGNSGNNYAITYVPANVGEITAAALTVTAQAHTRGYDGTTSSSVAPALAGALFDPLGSAALQTFDTRNVGTGKILTPSGLVVNDGNSGNNYAITYVPANVGQIDAAALTVTAQAHTRGYDGTTSSSVAPALAGTLFDPLGSAALQTFDTRNVGTGKTLTPSGLVVNDGNSGNNYAITYVPANVGQIDAAALTVTAQAHTRGYDGTTSSSVAPALAGTLFDAVGTPALQTFDTRNVGTGKTLTPSGLVVNDGNSGNNYAITYVPANVGQIDAAALTVTADAGQTKAYGSADPALTYSITAGSLFGGDTLAGALARAAGENVGAYAINQGTLADANYAISFAGNNFGVTPAPLAIRADDKSKLVGTPLPPFSATYTGFAFGETPASLGGALVYGTPATPGSAPGAYPITPSGQTSTNYTITFVDGLLTVSAGAPVASAAALLYRDTLVAIQGNLDTPVEIQGNRVAASLPVEYSDLVTIEDGGMRLPAGLKP